MVQSIDRAMSIIHILSSDRMKTEWSISELAELTNLPLSTLHRLLSSCIQHGLVLQNMNTKQYQLGYKWMEVGLWLLDSIDFRAVARPIMESLALEVEESIYLNIPSGTDGVTIEIVDSPLKVRIAENLGMRIPIHVGAPNKSMFAFMQASEVNQILDQINLPDPDRQELLGKLAEIRKQGYAISHGEKTEGTASVAAPILNYKDQVVAAVSINAPSFRFTKDRLPYLTERVKQTSEEISIKLGKMNG